MDSLRSRHLLSGVVIIIIGILALGTLLSLSIYQRETEAIAEELERTSLDLLGYLEYQDGRLLITEPTRPDADVFLDEQNLRTSGKARFAYLWDVEQKKVVWDSLDNDNVDQQKVTQHFALFDFEALGQGINDEGPVFMPAHARVVDSVPAADGEKPVQYMVAPQKFDLNMGGDKKAYLFIVAAVMADAEADIYELIMSFMVLLLVAAVLFLLAQLVFSWWVMAPVKKLEREIQAIGKGNKTLIENDYPAELKSMQNAINALIQRGNTRQ